MPASSLRPHLRGPSMPSLKELRTRAIEGFAFGLGFSLASLVFNITLQGVLFGIFAVLGLR